MLHISGNGFKCKRLRTDILSLSIIDYISTKVIPKNRYTNREVNTKQISTKGTNGSPQSLDID